MSNVRDNGVIKLRDNTEVKLRMTFKALLDYKDKYPECLPLVDSMFNGKSVDIQVVSAVAIIWIAVLNHEDNKQVLNWLTYDQFLELISTDLRELSIVIYSLFEDREVALIKKK